MTMRADIVCFSHLRWNFVYQRPNHLMARAARTHRVFFVEEPERKGSRADLETESRDGLVVVRPILPQDTPVQAEPIVLRELLDRFLAERGVELPWLWYYTPMALPWTAHIRAETVIYDCMDELSGFKFAPSPLKLLESELMRRADLVFAGGQTIYEAKRGQNVNTFLFPSSVDSAHFGNARRELPEPADQARIGRPRIGYFGVIDERIDLELIRLTAAARPDWNFVMVGPLAKITEEDVPRAHNLYWLGMKDYAELPAYLSGWDVAIMPFALNESTRHISPTKTPEYLSGGRPVVSTPINDVVHPYGDEQLVHIATGAEGFVAAIAEALSSDRTELAARADRFLGTQSWETTWADMERLVLDHLPQPVMPPRPATGGARPGRATAAYARPSSSGVGAGMSTSVGVAARPK
jgi:UDP-galactopyranose mutase